MVAQTVEDFTTASPLRLGVTIFGFTPFCGSCACCSATALRLSRRFSCRRRGLDDGLGEPFEGFCRPDGASPQRLLLSVFFRRASDS